MPRMRVTYAPWFYPVRVDENGWEWFACGGSTPEPWGCYGALLIRLAEQRKRGYDAGQTGQTEQTMAEVSSD